MRRASAAARDLPAPVVPPIERVRPVPSHGDLEHPAHRDADGSRDLVPALLPEGVHRVRVDPVAREDVLQGDAHGQVRGCPWALVSLTAVREAARLPARSA